MPPKPKTEVIHECVVLKAFVNQNECLLQLKRKKKEDDIRKIAGSYFSFPRNLIQLEDYQV